MEYLDTDKMKGKDTGCQKNWVLPNWAFRDPAANWEEILMIFVANLPMLNSAKLSFFWDIPATLQKMTLLEAI